MEQCVVRTYGTGYDYDTKELQTKLHDGWVVKHVTPIVTNQGSYIEYILEFRQCKEPYSDSFL